MISWIWFRRYFAKEVVNKNKKNDSAKRNKFTPDAVRIFHEYNLNIGWQNALNVKYQNGNAKQSTISRSSNGIFFYLKKLSLQNVV